VKDGDTIHILHKKKDIKVRLNEIDCPELGQDFGQKAKQMTSNLCFGKEVTLIIKGKDHFGRTLGDIILPDQKNLNHLLVEKGMAWHFKKYSKNEHLVELEQKAKESKVGLWSLPNPVAPWEFRKKQKAKK
jgi:micrococcal nuclease